VDEMTKMFISSWIEVNFIENSQNADLESNKANPPIKNRTVAIRELLYKL